MMAPSDDEWWYRRQREMVEEDAARAATRAAPSSPLAHDRGFHESMERFEDDSVPERVNEEPA